MSKQMMVDLWASTANVAALGNTQSGWFDIGKQTPNLEVTRTSTGGTYVLEIDWSRDGGATTLTTDTPPATAGVPATLISQARWCRLRVRNTHATQAFTAHNTQVTRDAGSGAR